MKKRIISTFSSIKIHQQVNVFIRYDHLFDPNPDGPRTDYTPFDDSVPLSLFLFGVDLKISSGVSLIPNFEWVKYRSEDEQLPSDDLYLKLTFSARW